MVLSVEITTSVKMWKQGEHQCLTTLPNREVIPKACYSYVLIVCSVCHSICEDEWPLVHMSVLGDI